MIYGFAYVCWLFALLQLAGLIALAKHKQAPCLAENYPAGDPTVPAISQENGFGFPMD
jgi:hypothetical protein